ncbi:Nickel/cobalt efflux system [Tolypocladium paradoxum]|uniref:Nickel/cobalt efflux system n=1 Tax=Tolypocladium paradoxum TaxID=94208 RepID=A0A2S4KRK3_9HYPO|nr:Nickel/cobalt efflux system [Tolypocladium paradoxum]
MRRLKLPPKPNLLRGIPSNSIAIIALLIAVNAVVWASVAVVLRFHPALISPAALSYTLGLRHALDADHISAIDLMTRRLIASGQRPATVGTFFSLGHSTIVIVTCVVVAATSGALRERFDGFTRVGNIVGTAVSATVLIILCLGNGWVLYRLVRRLQVVLAERRRMGEDSDDENAADAGAGQFNLEGAGFVARTFRFLFKAIDRPWKMYPLGVVFGLGFDTSSEIALLGMASLLAIKGTSIWLILIFPILRHAFSRDVVAILYYSVVLTAITVFVSAFIGIVQVLSLVQKVAEPEGSFWDGVSAIGDHFDIIGGSICGVFVVVGLGAIIVYRPWRRRMDRRRQGLTTVEEESSPEYEGLASPPSQNEPPRCLDT